MPTGVCQRRVKRLTKCKDVIMITKTTMLTGKILSKLLGCDNDNNAGEAEVLTGVCRHQIEFEQSGASSRFTGSHGIHGSLCERVVTYLENSLPFCNHIRPFRRGASSAWTSSLVP